jgi:hypothetical protein
MSGKVGRSYPDVIHGKEKEMSIGGEGKLLPLAAISLFHKAGDNSARDNPMSGNKPMRWCYAIHQNCYCYSYRIGQQLWQ